MLGLQIVWGAFTAGLKAGFGFNTFPLCAVAAQYALGVLTLVYVVPLNLALMHQAMAVAIVSLWVAMMHHVRRLDAGGR